MNCSSDNVDSMGYEIFLTILGLIYLFYCQIMRGLTGYRIMVRNIYFDFLKKDHYVNVCIQFSLSL